MNYLFLASLQFFEICSLVDIKAFNNHIAVLEGDWPR